MSFGGFGGFGSNNNNQSSGGFGGFGANNNNNNSGGFGSNTNTGSSIFGSNNNTTGSNMFGSNTNTSSPFGGGGFGSGSNTSNTGGAFGSKPFGSSTTGGGLFGGGGASSGSTFGGFGSNNNTTTNTTSAFGSTNSNAGGGLFGGAKTGGFGSSTTGGGLFGGGSNTTGGFGASTTNNTGGFGASTGGFGATANNQPNNGTASTPFSAFIEKDGTSSNATQHFQTITFQQPYTNYSLEELRLADYNQGRRYGNQNGQAGAFGQSTGFGGFGSNNNTATTSNAFGSNTTSSTGGGLFGGGANNNTTSAFGQSTGGFGANNNTSGGLFGQNKPATGGLFGSAGATTNTSTGGGLFGGGAATNTTGGFGSTGGGFGSSTTTGGGLFGNNNANQQKPAGGLFGGGAAATTNSNPFGGAATNTTTNAFGQSNTGGGGLFGQNNTATNTGGFGANNAAPNAGGGGLFGNTGGGFGQNNNQTQNNTTGGGLFGQPKPATGGLFGSSTTANTGGGGLFGQQNNTAQQSGGLFGNSAANNNTGGGGLFGQKAPATGGLFGNTNTNTGAATGGLFGSLGTQNTQQNAGGGLFGNQNNQPKTGGLFGPSAGGNTGGGLFGGMGQSTNQQSTMGNSLFQSQNNQQQNQGPANSLFGASGSSLLNTSMGTNPYGNDALFAGLATPTQSPGPLATPLSSSQKNKKSAILPQHKLNPAASTRLLTPQNKRPGGYGFTYSTYGTPSSVSSQSNSPGFGGSLFSGGAMSRSLSKSLSTSNLRNSFTPETSILSPGAFSTSTRGSGYGSLKRLNVRKDLNTRIPLFDEPPQKRVSFANGEGDSFNSMTNGDSNALVVRRDEGDASPRSSHGDMGGETPRASNDRVNGNHQLARVAEDSALTPKSSSAVNAQPGKDAPLGPYWSQPSLDQLKQMSKQELKSVRLIIGREGVGQITFNMGKPIDMSEVDLDKVFGDIVDLTARNATVYGSNCTALPKPVLGTGLNHPSEIVLGNSWPRNRAGKKDAKHLERLKRVGGTTFLDYNQATGEWSFTVPHFSSYGLNYDGEEYSDLDEEESSELSPVPNTPAQPQLRSSQMSGTPQDDSFVSPQSQSSPDDTFDFKKGMRSRASVPGGFGDEPVYEEDQEMEETNGQSFLGQRSVGSLDGQQNDDYYDESESELVQDQNMADSESPVQTTEQGAAKGSELMRSMQPKSILKASHAFKAGNGTPAKNQQHIFDDDWANQLQRTISPRKQDRPALRETQGNTSREQESAVPKLSQSVSGRNLTTAMDLMESLFGETEKQKAPKRASHGIELPYSKRPKTADDLNQLSEDDKKFHGCSRPHFSETGILIYGNKGAANLEEGLLSTAQEPLIGAAKDIRFAQVQFFADATPETLTLQKKRTKIAAVDGVPFATLQTDPAPVEFSEVAKTVAIDTAAGTHEQRAWQLLSLLFDDADKVPENVTRDQIHIYKKEQLSDFWRDLVWDDTQKHALQAVSAEEKAIAHLSCNSVPEACHALLEGLDLRLATMIAQIGGDASTRQNMSSQLDEWRRLDVLSEMEDSHRTLYELLAGNCAQSEGKAGPGRENNAPTFGISSRFALDWRRAFGLRLWYGIMADEPIELAVAQFADAIRDGLEDVKPVPWFVELNASTGWVDAQAEHREDLLWGILKLYAASKMKLDANIEDVLAPENTSGNPLNARLSFQLFQLFKSRRDDAQEAEERKIDMPTARGDGESEHRSSFISSTASRHEKDTQAGEPLVELGDKITLTYAASLHSRQHWTSAIWVYSHLSSSAMREHYIRSLLNQFVETFSLDESDATYIHLTRDMQVPETWLHAAAALQAKADDDALRQATHLIKADELNEAHDVLCRKVGPDAIISRDYDPLRELIGGFLPDSSRSPTSDRASVASTRASTRRKEPVQGWSQGGQIYFDYIELIDLTSQRSAYRVDEGLNQDIQDLLVKLQRSLEIAARDRLETCGLEERVALMEIAGTVAGQLVKNQHANHASILRLPLTEDLRLKHSCALSTSYYRNVMAGGR